MSTTGLHPDASEMEALFESIASGAVIPAETQPPERDRPAAEAAAHDVIAQIGRLTRVLHDSLRALGYDKRIATATAAVPQAHDRLDYVAATTEQAAGRALNAIDTAQPIQERLAADALDLETRWQVAIASGSAGSDALLQETRAFLRSVPQRAQATKEQLTEIMLAQEFQDLTGQVLKKIADVIHHLEAHLLLLLVEHASPDWNPETEGGLHGPAVRGDDLTEIATDQQQVDQLLDSLGF